MIYHDYQATTPLAPEAYEAMLPWLKDGFANPHSSHAFGRRAKAAVEVARETVAALLPAGGTLSFTSGATEALNWAIKGVGPGRIVTVATEHAAVLDTVEALRRQGREVVLLPVGADGLVDLGVAAAAIVPGTALVAVMLVNNEIGVVQPVAELAALAHAAGALLLCDAVQGYGRVPVPEACDMVAVSGHKVHGPKGIGALWMREGVGLEPLLHGGAQEAGGRSGTLSPALCVGFGVAAGLMVERAAADAAHVARLWEVATVGFGATIPLPERERAGGGSDLRATAVRAPSRPTPDPASGRSGPRPDLNSAGRCSPDAFPGRGEWCVNGSVNRRYLGNLNMRRSGLDVARLMSDLRDIAFSAGSACASGSGRSSHVLRALGLPEAAARSSIRLGFGRYTTETDLEEAVARIVLAAEAQGGGR